MSNFIANYIELNRYGKVYSQIQYDPTNKESYYALTFHNINKINTYRVENDIRPILSKCQTACHLNLDLVEAAETHQNLDDFIKQYQAKQKAASL